MRAQSQPQGFGWTPLGRASELLPGGLESEGRFIPQSQPGIVNQESSTRNPEQLRKQKGIQER
jgi:hypothetical protein